jgi:hypothetical protein
MLIDVTRLVDRMLQGRLPTGVDRVSLAYVQHFKERSRALIRFAGRWLTFNQSDSQRLFNALLDGDMSSIQAIRWCVARAFEL